MKTTNSNIVMNTQSVNVKGVMAEIRALKGHRKQKAAKTAKVKEAKVRKEIAARWEHVCQSVKYRKAALRESSKRIVADVESTLLDGVCYNLDGHCKDKSIAVQKRILRRIIEKRQAQAVHKIAKGVEGKYATYQVLMGTRKCMDAVHKYQFCA